MIKSKLTKREIMTRRSGTSSYLKPDAQTISSAPPINTYAQARPGLGGFTVFSPLISFPNLLLSPEGHRRPFYHVLDRKPQAFFPFARRAAPAAKRPLRSAGAEGHRLVPWPNGRGRRGSLPSGKHFLQGIQEEKSHFQGLFRRSGRRRVGAGGHPASFPGGKGIAALHVDEAERGKQHAPPVSSLPPPDHDSEGLVLAGGIHPVPVQFGRKGHLAVIHPDGIIKAVSAHGFLGDRLKPRQAALDQAAGFADVLRLVHPALHLPQD